MSNEAPTDDEVAAWVRAAVAGDFQPEHINGFPMRPDVGSINLAVPCPQPPPAPKAGGQAKPQATGPLTCGRAAASGKGEIGRRSASPGARQVGDAEPRPAPVREGPGASTRGGSRPASRGTGKRAVLPVGLKRTLEQAQPSMAKRLKVGAASKDSGSSDPRPPTGAESAPPRPLAGESAPSSPKRDARPMDEETQTSHVTKRTPWPAGLRSVEERRKKEEEGREQETRQQPQEEQRLQQEEGEEGHLPVGPQLEELLEQDRQQELQELQEQQQRRGQQLEGLLEPPSHSSP
ncbi:RNA polymerase II degradation factor 1-like [Sorghum bicolor]|uniref:RNA polymerase II degradation factor 1-like n=1 Tax=Sorghum bicolor TaxID=4558 RepID=UPI000B425CD7|nr:RNA polymerase II degradation factor 1-like [Sorghum bicolor]|eukprot:XP_021319201.1 RNA polymerase II degradation factor 1-like [Sorghum bicolor]